jgi:hypothetical protein
MPCATKPYCTMPVVQLSTRLLYYTIHTMVTTHTERERRRLQQESPSVSVVCARIGRGARVGGVVEGTLGERHPQTTAATTTLASTNPTVAPLRAGTPTQPLRARLQILPIYICLLETKDLTVLVVRSKRTRAGCVDNESNCIRCAGSGKRDSRQSITRCPNLWEL